MSRAGHKGMNAVIGVVVLPVERDIDRWEGQAGEFTDGDGQVRECVVRRVIANNAGLLIDYWRDGKRIRGAEIAMVEFRLFPEVPEV